MSRAIQKSIQCLYRGRAIFKGKDPILSEPQRILCIELAKLGDLVNIAPALMHLRSCFPRAKITLFARRSFVKLYEQHPAVDEIWSYPDNPYAVVKALRILWQAAFDWAISMSPTSRNSLFCILSRAKNIAGFLDGHRSFTPWLVSHDIRIMGCEAPLATVPPGCHLVDRPNKVVEILCGSTVIDRRPALIPSQFSGKNSLKPWGRGSHLGILQLYVKGPTRQWPVERFRQLMSRLLERPNFHWAILCSNEERDDLEVILPQALLSSEDVSLHTGLEMPELLELISSAQLLIAMDSGPSHIASALGIPTIVLMGPAAPEMTGPLGDTCVHLFHHVECCPCDQIQCIRDEPCMTLITLDEVIEAIDKIEGNVRH